MFNYLGYKSRSCRRFVSPVRWQHLLPLVITDESVDTTFYKNESEFGVLVLTVSLEMFADADSTLDQVVEVIWVLWGETLRFENT